MNDMVDINKEVYVRSIIIKRVNKALYKNVTKNSFFDYIPLNEMKEAIRPLGFKIIQEDGMEWEGFFCGESGSCKLMLGYDGGVVKNSVLVLNWYGSKVHGIRNRVEINAYIS